MSNDLGYYEKDRLLARTMPNVTTVYAVARGIIRPKHVILDIGCGTGLDVNWLRRNGYLYVTGFDNNDLFRRGYGTVDFIVFGKRLFGEELPIYEADMKNIPVPDNSIDCMIANGVFHASNLHNDGGLGFRQTLAEIERVSRGGAVLVGHEFSEKDGSQETRLAITEWGCEPAEYIVEELDRIYDREYVEPKTWRLPFTDADSKFLIWAYKIKD